MTDKKTEAFPAQAGELEILPTFGENDPQGVSCAYNVVISTDDDGKKNVLLAIDDRGNWRLPGASVEHGQEAEEVADAALLETDIELAHDMRIKDKEKNGKNEITSFIRVAYNQPEDSDAITAKWFSAKWFNLESIAEQATGHTADIAQKTIERFKYVDEKMREAQDFHDQGDYDQAITLWKLVEATTPDPLRQSEAMRNWALSSSMRGLPGSGQDAANVALSIFNAFAEKSNLTKEEIQRERLEHARAYGSILLHSLMESERQLGNFDPESQRKAKTATDYLRQAALGGSKTPILKKAIENDPDSIRRLAILNTLYSSKHLGKIEAMAVLQKTPLKAAQILLANLLEPARAPGKYTKIDELRRRVALKIAIRNLY